MPPGWWSRHGVDAVYSSPMRRARETAAPLAEIGGHEIVTDDGLKEFDHHLDFYVPIEELRADEDAWARLVEEWLSPEAEARRQGAISVLSGLLGLADNVDRALQVDPEHSTVDQIRQGLSVIRDELQQLLAAHSVCRVDPAEGDEFDPERHEALLQTPHPDVEPGRVVMTLQVGYAMGDRTLRPAKVSVAREPEGE